MPSTTQTKQPLSFSRRRALQVGGAGALFTLGLSACSGDDSDQAAGGDQNTAPSADRPQESPMLTEMVDAGDLPPLEERLPASGEELVVDTPEFGEFGGTYNGAVASQTDDQWLQRIIAFEPILRPTPDLTEMGEPGTMKSVDISDDGAEYTLHLREGLKWSDGEPVTSDDVMFAIEDVLFNSEIFADPPNILSVDGEPCTAEQIDDYTVQLAFPQPKGDFIDLASREINDGNLLRYPKHYLEQFLPDLNDEAEEVASDAGYADWTSYWEDRLEWYNNPELPTLHAWVTTSPLNQGESYTAERNPYFWKVDSEGAQFPFIDVLQFAMVQEEEVMLLNAMDGELDFHARHFNLDANRPVLADAREEGDFEFLTVQTTSMNHAVISLNLNHQDDNLREVFNNRDFRIGLSHAINRQEVIDTVYQRQGQPWQAAPRPDSEYYDEEFGTQYTEFDVDLANDYLDSAGYTDTNSDGFRLGPDGDIIRFDVDVTSGGTERIAAMDLITSYWQDVGIDARVNTIERTLFYDRKTAAANEHDANVWGGDGGFRVETIDTRWWFPSGGESNFAPRWAEWFLTRGEGGDAEEPSEPAQRQMELYWDILLETDPDVQAEYFREILDIAKEEFYVIGVLLPEDEYGIVKNHMRNVPNDYANTSQFQSPGHMNPFIWFFDQ